MKSTKPIPEAIDRELEAATPIRNRRLSASLDRLEAQIDAAVDARVRRAFQRVRDALLDKVPDR